LHLDLQGKSMILFLSASTIPYLTCVQGDWEFLSQYPVSAFKSCEIRALQHRKQSPTLPTLMLEMKPDSPSDKQRKRRSSRTAGLTSKDPWGNILLFRAVVEDPRSIYEWQQAVMPLLTPDEPEDSPLSPMSPLFTNPFASSRTASNSNSRADFQVRPSTQHQNTYPHAPPPRERPSALISPSPSLRSRRSDLSSQSSSLHPPMGFTSSHPQTYGTLPNGLPSPALTSGYETQFIEGWTSAQGRSSALSSHTRGSNSIASAVAPALPGSIGSSPPGPRETILDRAFQMRCIPGSERVSSPRDDEKISSIARFEALMAEHDQRKQAKLATSQSRREGKDWDLDEESETSDSGEVGEDEDDAEGLEMSDHEIVIPTPAKRALDYISGRIPPPQRTLSPTRSPPIPFLNSQAMDALHGNLPPATSLRPRTGIASSRNGGSRPNSLALPSRSISTTAVPSAKDNGSLQPTDTSVKRRSSTSVKRLSFSEFAKRLSSTSSLLLVQTNASSSSGRDGSRRGSSEYGVEEPLEREKLGMRGGGGQNLGVGMGMGMGMGESRSERDKRCGWRGSVGVFGSEGGFL